VIERKYVVNQEFVDELKWILDRLIDEEYDITKIYGDRKLIERVYSMVSDLRKA
tara:strand:+ start:582 stop:743 length:162 start_codon:yes stop_codon:yes gene_type:complete